MTVAQLYAQPALLSLPMVGLVPIRMRDANRLLVAWGHRLGEINRPFTMAAFALEVDGRPISVAVSASIVSDVVARWPEDHPRAEERFRRTEVVECARLCSEPGNVSANRVMLRLWREVCAPRWPDWPVKAAISYAKNAFHRGDIYRTDGWRLVSRAAGSKDGSGKASRKREKDDVRNGFKSLWIWEYAA